MTREEIYNRFEELDKRASLGGGVDKIEKQHAQGKMTARERIGMLLDNGGSGCCWTKVRSMSWTSW